MLNERTNAKRNLCAFVVVAVSLLALGASAAAQSSSIDTKLAAQYFQQLKQTSDREGGKTWGDRWELVPGELAELKK